MLSSLFIAADQEFMPILVKDQGAAAQILQLFPEIKYHYGDSIETEIYFDLSVGSGDFLSVNQYSGIEVGKKDKARAKLIVKCKNSTIP